MNTYKIIPVITILILTIGISSCSKSFLEPDPKGLIVEDQYYKNPEQAYAGLVAAYASLNTEILNTFTNQGTANSASDDCYAGGGGSTDMYQWQVLTNFSLLKPGDSGNSPDEWNAFFQGVKDCNLLLAKLEAGVPGLSDNLTKRYIAECKFLRAHYYFDLARWYGNVPLILKPLPFNESINAANTFIANTTNATPEEVYSQVKKDLLEAMPNLPQTVTGDEKGRAYVGAAEAILGKVLLHQASLYQNGIVLTKNTTLAKQEYDSAIIYLKDVNGDGLGVNSNNKFGYKLQTDYGSIFIPTNKFNSESVFEIQKGANQEWGKTNIYAMMLGPRGFKNKGSNADFIDWGWSFNPVTTDLRDFMATSNNGSFDPRYNATIINLDSLANAGLCEYNKNSCYMATGYFIAKYAPLWKYADPVSQNFGFDYIEIRLADTYLMEAEAQLMSGSPNQARALTLINAVRARVGLPALSVVTLSDIKKERRLELATEGHRYFDLVRWGDAAQALNNMKVVSNLGGGVTFGGSKHYTAPKNYLLPIQLQNMANTKVNQNPGY